MGGHADGGASVLFFVSSLTTMGHMWEVFVTKSTQNAAGRAVSQKGSVDSMKGFLIW